MITLEELNPHKIETTVEQKVNMLTLWSRLNKVREAFAKPMLITSGVRDAKLQAAINPKAPNSAHTRGQAADILDLKGVLKTWCNDNVPLLEEIGLWMEDFDYTRAWVHMQTVPPKSGHRFFIP